MPRRQASGQVIAAQMFKYERSPEVAESCSHLCPLSLLISPWGMGTSGCLSPKHEDALTFGILPAQLPLLDEAPEHLGLHENLQEAAQALGGDCFAEGLSLQGPLLTLARCEEQGVMAHDLHEESDEGFRHHLVQGAGLRA